MEKIIEVQNLIKRYKKSKTNSVDNVSFSVRVGEFFAFLGPNGAGKTTTISILTTTLSKTSGKISIAGFDIDKEASKVRQNIGVIFQKPSLDLNLTAEENIRFHAALYGLYAIRPTFSLMPPSYQKKVHKLSKVLGIEEDVFKPVKTFSGGMRRKLEIVRSLMHSPKILFLDEPTSGLDPLSRRSLWNYLNEVRKNENTTIFLTTHYLDEAEDADRVAIINQGKIITLGTPLDIKKNLTEEYLILDSKKRNDLKKELDREGLSYLENGIIKVKLNGKNVQKIIQSIKVPLSVLKIHSPTLEEAYLELIERKNEGS